MLIASAPIVIPVNTANLPTESVAAEAVQRPRIPQAPSAAENSSTKNSTEFTDQPKGSFENNLQTEQDKSVAEKQQSQQQEAQQDNDTQRNKESSENRSKDELAAEELQQVQSLRNRDREVRAHEQAHAAVGGSLAGAPNLNFTTGPDGKRYAISGDVSIDISKVSDNPSATIRKLEQVQRAALAPANPSSQDLRVAAKASAGANQARGELNIEQLEKTQQARKTVKSDTEGKTNVEKSESLSFTTESGEIALEEREPVDTQSLSSSGSQQTEQLLNPVVARRQAAQLNQKIVGSGALDFADQDSRLSLIA